MIIENFPCCYVAADFSTIIKNILISETIFIIIFHQWCCLNMPPVLFRLLYLCANGGTPQDNNPLEAAYSICASIHPLHAWECFKRIIAPLSVTASELKEKERRLKVQKSNLNLIWFYTHMRECIQVGSQCRSHTSPNSTSLRSLH